MPAPTPSPPPHPLPFPFSSSAAAPLDLVAQGAEGLVYCTTLPDAGTRVALKVRPRKLYRHPALDARLARSRALAEARVLVRCRRRGVDVPAVVAADWDGRLPLSPPGGFVCSN
jgi:TP53 regulating kinase-like protein